MNTGCATRLIAKPARIGSRPQQSTAVAGWRATADAVGRHPRRQAIAAAAHAATATTATTALPPNMVRTIAGSSRRPGSVRK